jgi:hypothetical protein
VKISKFTVISLPVVYIVLGYAVFPIKYTSPVGTAPGMVFMDRFLNLATHLWGIKIIISLFIALIVNLIIGSRKYK